ncbi:MAG: adenylate/guanylate cyclase domain-containing protein [bacterium]
MVAKLFFKRENEEREITSAPLLTIGRVPPNDIIVPHPKVSRNHAMIRMLQSGEYYLIDIGSTNGTQLNGKRIVVPMLLKDGDVITIEDCTLTFQAQQAQAQGQGEEAIEEGQAEMTIVSIAEMTSEITILVCDIRNYTVLSEKLPTNQLAQMMAKWFTVATQAIEEQVGTIDKFIGDAIMVRWTIDYKKDVKVSVLHALNVARKLNEISAEINSLYPGLPVPFRVGVGINTGRAVLGNMGGAGYREYTALGDAVNMAFRFESESKKIGKDVVIGYDSCIHLPKTLWEHSLETVSLKGKAEAVSVWAITFDVLKRLSL